jgi:hypothetical protein
MPVGTSDEPCIVVFKAEMGVVIKMQVGLYYETHLELE